MQCLSSLLAILVAIVAVSFSPPGVEAQKDIQTDTIASLVAGTKECSVVHDYCYGIDTHNVLLKGPMVSHGFVAVAAIIHEIALGLHAQNETVPFDRPSSVVLKLHNFSDALESLLGAVAEGQAIFVGAGLKQDFIGNLAILVVKLDFFIDELAINIPKPYRNEVNDVKYSLDGAVENCIRSFS